MPSFPHLLSRSINIQKWIGETTSAATTTIDSSALDMSGYEGLIAIGSIATTATDNGLSIWISTSTSTAQMEAVKGSFLVADSATSLVIDIGVLPFKGRANGRFAFARYRRTTSSKLGPLYAIRYGARNAPVDNGTNATQNYLALGSPSTGSNTDTTT